VNAGAGGSLAIDDYVRERGALAGLDDDVRGVHAVVAELVQDGLARPVVGEFREDGWPQAEPGDRGEGVAAVSATLRFEGVGAELLVGLGEGRDGREVVHSGAADSHDPGGVEPGFPRVDPPLGLIGVGENGVVTNCDPTMMPHGDGPGEARAGDGAALGTLGDAERERGSSQGLHRNHGSTRREQRLLESVRWRSAEFTG